ncbi:MAG: hypothetical protein WC734_02585 [Patescibacteria group bacterium]
MDGPPKSRTLTALGLQQCLDHRVVWQNVITAIPTDQFGEPVYRAGPSPAMILTCYHLFQPGQIEIAPELAVCHSLKELPGDWFQIRVAADMTRAAIFQDAYEDRAIREESAIGMEARRLRAFLDGACGTNRFVVAVSDEPAITLALLDVVPSSALALAPGEGVIVYRDLSGHFIGAQKVAFDAPVSV